MDIVFEFLLELFFEGSLEIAKNKKVSKWIRYPLMAIITGAFILVIGLIFFVGIIVFKESWLASMLFIALGMFMLLGSIYKLHKLHRDQNR